MKFGGLFYNYVKSHKIRILLIAFFVILVTIISLIPAQILRVAVDEIILKNNKEKLFVIAVIYVFSFLVIGVVTYLKNISLLKLSIDFTCHLRIKMMEHIHKLDYKSLVKYDSGSLEGYFNNDVSSINDLFTNGVINMITDLLKIIGISITIFIYSIKFGLIVLVCLPLLFLFTLSIRKRMLKAQFRSKSLEGNVNKTILENIENIEQIKINKAYDYAVDKYDSILLNHFKANQASNFYDSIFPPLMQMFRNIIIVTILLVSGFNNDIFGMSVGMIISAITLITDLFSPIENLGMEIQTIQKSIAGVKRINEFFEIPTENSMDVTEIKDYNILYKEVDFAYTDQEIIKDFNLSIKYGDRIVFQGASGSGKTTLMRLAMGLIRPTKGEVLIGGIDSYNLSLELRRKIFAIIYQEPFFSDGTIYEEISLLDLKITKEQVFEALNLVGLDYIKDIDIKLNPLDYSSGELALFNIARIIVLDPKIIFLDEMNAKIDPLTSKRIMDLIDRITINKTVISINHYGSVLSNSKIINL